MKRPVVPKRRCRIVIEIDAPCPKLSDCRKVLGDMVASVGGKMITCSYKQLNWKGKPE